MRKPILPKARKVRRADRSVAIELDAHLGVLVLRLEPKRSAFELIHSFFINLDVPIKRGLVATLEKRMNKLKRSEEHTSELQSPMYLVCRLLLEKKKNQRNRRPTCSRPPRQPQ